MPSEQQPSPDSSHRHHGHRRNDRNNGRSSGSGAPAAIGLLGGILLGAAVVGLFNYFFPEAASGSEESNEVPSRANASRTYKMPTTNNNSNDSNVRQESDPAVSSTPSAPNASEGLALYTTASESGMTRESALDQNAIAESCAGVQSSAALAASDPSTEKTAAALCMICLDVPAVMLFTECGHLCCCEDCLMRMAQSAAVREGDDVVLRCPLCRTHSTLQKVYLP